jgi:uncharacterized membrane protein
VEERPVSGDRRDLSALELAIGRVLRIGIMASSACLAAGLLLTLVGYGGNAARAVLSAGLIVLLATPAARVVISVVEYIRDRDWPFVALTLTVLLALLGSVIAALIR